MLKHIFFEIMPGACWDKESGMITVHLKVLTSRSIVSTNSFLRRTLQLQALNGHASDAKKNVTEQNTALTLCVKRLTL